MILYFITCLCLVRSCGTLPTDDSLNLSHFHYDSITAPAIQQHSNKLVLPFDVPLNAVRRQTTIGDYRSNVEQIGDRWVDHRSIQDDIAANQISLRLKLMRIKNAAALPWQPPPLPQAVQDLDLAPTMHTPNEGYMTLCNLIAVSLVNNCKMCADQASAANRSAIETTSNHLLRLIQKVTGCLYRSGVFLATTKAQGGDLVSHWRNPQTSASQPLLGCGHRPHKFPLARRMPLQNTRA